ncbi:MAG: septation regulator SpoVG [Candidatus Dependentiae bacterium]|jgi:stage V sporulation protein G
MEITEVKLYPTSEGRLKAYVSLVFNNCFIVREIKLVEGEGGLFVSMPSRRRNDGSFKDIAHPLNTEMRSEIEKRIIEEYNKFCSGQFYSEDDIDDLEIDLIEKNDDNGS